MFGRKIMSTASVVLVIVLTFQVSMIELISAAIFEERPYHDEPYYPPDLDGASSTGPSSLDDLRWSKTVLTYRIINYPALVPTSVVRATIRRAFDAWSRVTNMDFLEQPRTAHVDIQLAFEGMNHQRRGLACKFSHERTLAHAFLPESGDVHFNTRFFFADGTLLEEFLNTAIHELGHSLGLLHSSSKASIMYGSQLVGQMFVEPQPEDVLAIQAIYGVRSTVSPTTQKPLVTTHQTPKIRPQTTTELCSLPSFDTIVVDHHGHICVLSGRFYYNLNETDHPPRKIAAKWPRLPTGVNAAITHRDHKTYFFKGDKYWKYDKRNLEENYPRAISEGFRGVPSNLDAVLLCNTGGFIAFKGGLYWEFDSQKPVHEAEVLPKPIQDFLNFPKRVDATLTLTESEVPRRFIFSGLNYYEIDDNNHIVNGRGDVRKDWFSC